MKSSAPTTTAQMATTANREYTVVELAPPADDAPLDMGTVGVPVGMLVGCALVG